MVKIKRSYGWIPDESDKRDLLFGSLHEISGTLPSFIDWRVQCTAVENQGSIGSCTANAVVAMMEFLDKKEDNRFFNQSRLFLYYNTRRLQGTINDDSGASLRYTLKAYAKWGICSEKIWPYIIKNFKIKPTDECYRQSTRYRLLSYLRLNVVDEMKQCLADGYLFVGGIKLYSSSETRSVRETGVIPVPKSGERYLGGHAICFVGFDDEKQRFIFKNSWSKSWGESGYGYVSYKYVEKYGSDFWTARTTSGF